VLGTRDRPAVVRGPNGYPYCNVAMFMGALSQPTWRTGRDLHLRPRPDRHVPAAAQQWQKNKSRSLMASFVYVWTSNKQAATPTGSTRSLESKTMSRPRGKTSEKLWLQTSTLVSRASRIPSCPRGDTASQDPSSYAAAHPTPRIVKCG
jgi:hypothetical protein